MNLYRLDFLNPDGSVRAAVTDLLGDYLTRSAMSARQRAITESGLGNVIAITRISGAGSMRRMSIVENGAVHRV